MSLVDIGRGICRSMGSTLIMSSIFIPAERECSINIISFLMYGESDDARQLQGFRQFFIRTENSHHKKFLFEWCCNSLANADELIIAIVNLRMFVTLEEFYNYFGSWSKLLAKFCKRDQVPLAVKISEDRTHTSNSTINSHSISRITFEFTIFFANSLQIHYLFQGLISNSQSFSRIHFEFRIFFCE